MSEENKDELEYNDGLGDLLREKESMQFSWAKTAGIIVALIVLIAIGIWAFFSSNSSDKDAIKPNYVTEESSDTNDISAITDAEIENLNIKATSTDSDIDGSHVDAVIQKLMQDQDIAEKAAAEPAVDSSTIEVPQATFYRVIAGVYTIKGNAEQAVARLAEHNIPAFVRPAGPSEYHVQAGAFHSESKANRHLATLKGKGFDGAKIQTKR